MASKKCPKCGEDNPAEAVMCWACYTPLSASAPLGAGLGAVATAGAVPKTAGSPVGVPTVDASGKKAIDPKILGVGAFLAVAGLAAFMMNGAMGGTGDTSAPMPSGAQGEPLPPDGAPAQGFVPPPAIVPGPGGAPGALPPVVPAPFKTVASPNGGSATGTVGILMTTNASPDGAARFAKAQFARSGSWKNMQIAVFTDAATADAFGQYQRNRKNAPLTNADFKALGEQGVWNTTPAFLDARGRSEQIYYPSKRPLSWWPSR